MYILCLNGIGRGCLIFNPKINRWPLIIYAIRWSWATYLLVLFTGYSLTRLYRKPPVGGGGGGGTELDSFMLKGKERVSWRKPNTSYHSPTTAKSQRGAIPPTVIDCPLGKPKR